MRKCLLKMKSFAQRHSDEWDNFDIENWDFSKVSRSDAKLLARSFISYVSVAIFAYCLIACSIFFAIFLCMLKKARVSVERHEAAQGPYKHHHHHQQQPSVVADVNGTYRAANGLGYERANISEPAEESLVRPQHQYFAPQANQVPRGFSIN